MSESIEVRVFTKLVEDGEVELKEPGQYIWTDEAAARAKYKRFHGDPVKFCAYLAADVEKVAEISKKAAELTGEIEDLAKINGSLTATANNYQAEIAQLNGRIEALKLENQATNSLLRDEAERRRIAEEKLYTIKRLLEPEYPFQRPPNLNAPFYRQLQQFGHLGVPVYAPSLAFWAKKVESYDSGKVIANVNVLAYNDGRVGADRQLKPGDLVRAVDGQVWQILAPMESQP